MALHIDRSELYPATVELYLPDRQALITRLRQSNTVFAEICRDYELLAGDLNALSQSGSSSHSGTQAERDLLLESLQALVREIKTVLERNLGG
jgi:hypothetical protein